PTLRGIAPPAARQCRRTLQLREPPDHQGPTRRGGGTADRVAPTPTGLRGGPQQSRRRAHAPGTHVRGRIAVHRGAAPATGSGRGPQESRDRTSLAVVVRRSRPPLETTLARDPRPRPLDSLTLRRYPTHCTP